MKEDKWITPQEARVALMQVSGVVRVMRVPFSTRVRGARLEGVNEQGVSLFSCRIFDGTEHPLARPNMVLDWRECATK